MKKLALLMFAILILSCDTETPVVEEPLPVIEASAPDVALGEHLRLDFGPIGIMDADIIDGDVDVDPEPFNKAGIRLVLNGLPFLYRVDLRVDGGASLGWLPRGVVHHADIEGDIRITPVDGRLLLEFNTAYIITFFAQNFACDISIEEIRFRTKPKP